MKASGSLIAALFAAAFLPSPSHAQSAPTIGPGSVIRLRNQPAATCSDSGTVIALRRDSAVVALPSAGAGVLDCRLFTQRVVSVADLDVWMGSTRGAWWGAWRGALAGPIAGAFIGVVAASRSQRPQGGFAAVAGGALGLLLGPAVGAIIGASTASDVWVRGRP